MNVFKMRAECTPDVAQLLEVVGAERVEVDGYDGSAEVTLTNPFRFDHKARVRIDLDLESLRAVLDGLVDCHVMSQTLMPLAEYTGDRVWHEEQAAE